MPTPTVAQRHKLNRDPIADPQIILLEFQEDGNSNVQRAVINTEDVTWQGNVYYKASIDITFPNSGGGGVRAQMTASNVNRVLGRALNAATQRINVRLIQVDLTNPDEPMLDSKNLLIIPSASGKAATVTAELAPRASLQEPVPFKRTTKQDYPGVFLA